MKSKSFLKDKNLLDALAEIDNPSPNKISQIKNILKAIGESENHYQAISNLKLQTAYKSKLREDVNRDPTVLDLENKANKLILAKQLLSIEFPSQNQLAKINDLQEQDLDLSSSLSPLICNHSLGFDKETALKSISLISKCYTTANINDLCDSFDEISDTLSEVADEYTLLNLDRDALEIKKLALEDFNQNVVSSAANDDEIIAVLGLKNAQKEVKKLEDAVSKVAENLNITKQGEKEFVEAFKQHLDNKTEDARKTLEKLVLTDDSFDSLKQQELSLRSHSYPKEGDFRRLCIPELRNVSLTKFNKRQNSYEIKFQNEEDRNAFYTRLSWNYKDGDGNKLNVSDLAEDYYESGKNSIILYFKEEQKFPINELIEIIKKSDEAKEEVNKNAERREDRTTKKIIAGVVNGATFGVPVIGGLCHFTGKVFQAAHHMTGVGDSFAKMFFSAADLTYTNSNWGCPKFLKEDVKNSVEQIDDRNVSFVNSKDIAGKVASFIVRRPAAVVNGALGGLCNFLSGGYNMIGDAAIGASEKCLKKLTREDVNPIAKVGYGLVGTITFAVGAPFRLLGMGTRTVGKILSESASVYNKSKTAGEEIKGWSNAVVSVSDTMTTRELLRDKYKTSQKIDFDKAKTLDEHFEKVRKRAKEIFEDIRDPKYTVSGISGDEREYCEVAQVRFSNQTYSMLYSPIDGAVSLVSSSKDQNSGKTANGWPQDIGNNVNKNSFIKLISHKPNDKDNRKYSVKKNDRDADYIKIAKNGEKGLTYKEFEKKLSGFKSGEDKEFKIGTSEYQIQKDKNGSRLFHKTRGGFEEELFGLDQFRVINDLYKTNAVSTEETKGKNNNKPKGKDIKIISVSPLSKALEKASTDKIYVR